ncbi:MAG: hypothetical protein ABJF07_23525, partial [Nisaea sp.]
MRSAITRAKRRGRLGLWQRRLTIIALTAIAVLASYFFTLGAAKNYQHLVGITISVFGICALIADWVVSRDIKRGGGVQAMRSGGTLSTGPGAMAGRLWAQGEGFRLHGLNTEARENFNEAESLFKEAKDADGVTECKISLGKLDRARDQTDDASKKFEAAYNTASEAKNRTGMANALLQQGYLLINKKSADGARQAFEEAGKLYIDENSRFGEANAALGAAEASMQLTKSDEAAGAFEHAHFLFSQVGDRNGEAHALYC